VKLQTIKEIENEASTFNPLQFAFNKFNKYRLQMQSCACHI